MARHLDEGHFQEVSDLYTEDARRVLPTGEEVLVRAVDEASRRRAAADLKPRIVTNVIVTPTGPDTAEGFAYVTLPRELVPQGEWHYRFRKIREGWRITWFKAVGIERGKGESEKLAHAAHAVKTTTSQ